jgi:hypothetical protein
MATATKERKKKLTLGRPALVVGTQQTLSNLFWRLSISMMPPKLCLLFVLLAHQCCLLAPGDVIFAQLACPLNDVIFLLTSGKNLPISLQTLSEDSAPPGQALA